MDESELIFNMLFILFCWCIICPPTEFESLGWTIENIFSRFLGSEQMNFIRYHQKRTSLTLFIHSILPGLYFLIYYLKFYDYDDDDDEYTLKYSYKATTWKVAQRISLFAAIFIFSVISYWSINDWSNHPISKELIKFSNLQNSNNNYHQVANDIGNEFRRDGILKIKINSISSVILTENWIMKTTLYFVNFAHQSDTSLNVNKSETFQIAADTTDLLQMINIVVKPSRPNVHEFYLRINALDFNRLQDRIDRTIVIPSNIQFHLDLVDRFIDVFKNQVRINPIIRIETNQILDTCFACMLIEPNIKIQKHCIDMDEDGNPLLDDEKCENCYCRPMWCIDCLARWFASRQNQHERELWLSKKSTCPLCRAKFCLLDVCYIEKIQT